MKNILVTFDIDGTMLYGKNSVNFHADAFSKAIAKNFKEIGHLESFLGHPVDGWMDRKIIRDIIKKLGFEASDENIQKACDDSQEIFVSTYEATPILTPGIERVLKELSDNPNVTIGVASGNIEGIAWKKLSNAGIEKYFKGHIGGFGGYVFERSEALMMAREGAEKATGKKFDKIFHIGDMPSDINAAIQTNATPIGVLTGGTKQFNPKDYSKSFTVLENLDVGYDQLMKMLFE